MSWPDLNEISDQTEKLLRQIYEENGFCFETRLSMAEFLTTNFMHQNLERGQICKVVDQFLENLNDYLSKINKSRDTALFTQRRTLTQTRNNLKVRTFTVCLFRKWKLS